MPLLAVTLAAAATALFRHYAACRHADMPPALHAAASASEAAAAKELFFAPHADASR